jgi:hypothetical protein
LYAGVHDADDERGQERALIAARSPQYTYEQAPQRCRPPEKTPALSIGPKSGDLACPAHQFIPMAAQRDPQKIANTFLVNVETARLYPQLPTNPHCVQ